MQVECLSEFVLLAAEIFKMEVWDIDASGCFHFRGLLDAAKPLQSCFLYQDIIQCFTHQHIWQMELVGPGSKHDLKPNLHFLVPCNNLYLYMCICRYAYIYINIYI